jgi:hypothetical protein
VETISRKLFENSAITDKNGGSEEAVLLSVIGGLVQGEESHRQDLHIGEQQCGELGVHRNQ